jgi:uncharacterized protein (DUF486 family)
MALSQNLSLAILVIGLIIYAFFNTLASYSFKHLIPLGKSMEYIFLIEMFFIIIAYMVKIPLYFFFAGSNGVTTIHVLDIAIYSVVVVLYARFYLKEQVHLHTVIILNLIIALTILNEVLNRLKLF